MTEIISNSIQIAVLIFCLAYAIYSMYTQKDRLWLLYGLFMLSFLLGDIWWLLEIIFYGWDFDYSLIPYINWKASLLFLILMIWQHHPESVFKKPVSKLMWLIPVFCAAMCIYYMQFGAYVDNTVTAVLMSITIWIAIQRAMESRREGTKGQDDWYVCRAILIFCIIEYVMWTASCLDYDNPLRHLYTVGGYLLTVCIIYFIPAIRKAVSR